MLRGKRGAFVFYGAPGSGKSEQAAMCFEDSLAILTGPNNLHFFETRQAAGYYQKKNKAKRAPRTQFVIDRYIAYKVGPDGFRQDVARVTFDAQGNMLPIPQRASFDAVFSMALQTAFSEYSQYGYVSSFSNLILDEGGTLAHRIFDEVRPYCVKDGKFDAFRAYNSTADWYVSWYDRLRQLTNIGVNICMVAHDKDPDQTKDKAGGPNLVSQDIMKRVCADSDGVLYRYIEDPAPSGFSFQVPPPAAPGAPAAPSMSSLALPPALTLTLPEAVPTPPAAGPNTFTVPTPDATPTLGFKSVKTTKLPHYRWRTHASEWHMSKQRGLEALDLDTIRDMDADDILRMTSFVAYEPRISS